MKPFYWTIPLAKIRIHAILVLAVMPVSCLLAQEDSPTASHTEKAEIIHHMGTARVITHNSRPLHQAVSSLSEEYGWQIDYEDPVYDPATEIVDADDPAWRASHPEATRVVVPNGGPFEVEYSEAVGTDGKVNQSSVLNGIVSAFNSSLNPGSFTLEREPGGTVSVVGISKGGRSYPESSGHAFLGTAISLPAIPRSLDVTVATILNLVREKTGVQIRRGSGPTQFVLEKTVTVGGSDVPARDLLRDALNQTGRTWRWSLLFEPTQRSFHFNILPVVVAVVSSDGRRSLVSVDPSPSRHPY